MAPVTQTVAATAPPRRCWSSTPGRRAQARTSTPRSPWPPPRRSIAIPPSPKYTGAAFAQALYLDRGGARDLVIAATEANEVAAFDPTGAVAWRVELGAPQPMPNAADGANCGNGDP